MRYVLPLLLLTACSVADPEPQANVTLRDPWINPRGTRGGVTVTAHAPEPTRLRVRFARKHPVLDTTIQGTLQMEAHLPVRSKQWGRPPNPYGDCYTAHLPNATADTACAQRPVHYPTPTSK